MFRKPRYEVAQFQIGSGISPSLGLLCRIELWYFRRQTSLLLSNYAQYNTEKRTI